MSLLNIDLNMQSLFHPLKTIQPQVENRNFRRSAIRERTGSARCEINLIKATIYSFLRVSFDVLF